MIVGKADAKAIRAVINTLAEGPQFSVAHSDATYKNWVRNNSLIRKLNELLPDDEKVKSNVPANLPAR